MATKSVLSLILGVTTAGVLTVALWAGTPATPGRAPAAPAGLGAAMKDMDRMVRALKTDAADPAKRDESLKNIATLQRDVAIAKLSLPPQVAKAEGEAKAKGAETYRVMLTGLLRTLLDLEDAVVAKKPDDIKKHLAKIEEFETKGHAEFGVGG